MTNKPPSHFLPRFLDLSLTGIYLVLGLSSNSLFSRKTSYCTNLGYSYENTRPQYLRYYSNCQLISGTSYQMYIDHIAKQNHPLGNIIENPSVGYLM
jgi:hypothetical protein